MDWCWKSTRVLNSLNKASGLSTGTVSMCLWCPCQTNKENKEKTAWCRLYPLFVLHKLRPVCGSLVHTCPSPLSPGCYSFQNPLCCGEPKGPRSQLPTHWKWRVLIKGWDCTIKYVLPHSGKMTKGGADCAALPLARRRTRGGDDTVFGWE